MIHGWSIVDAFTYPFMERALITMVVLAVTSGLVGFFISLRDLEFVSDGLIHAVFPGLVIGYGLGGITGVLPGAFVAGLVAAVVLTIITRASAVGQDAAVAVVLTSAFSLGVVIVSKQENYVSQLEALFFGRLLTVTPEALTQITIVAAIAVALVAVTWRRQLFRAFDPIGFSAAGLNVFRTDLVLNVAVAMLVVAGVQAIGNLLVLSLLIVPMAISRLLSPQLRWLIPISIAVTVASAVAGLWLSFDASVTLNSTVAPGPLIVIVLLTFYVAALMVFGARRLVRARAVAAS